MNGLEAVNKLKNESYCNCSLSDDNKFFCMGGLLKDSDELKAIERELKVNKLLKAKKVDLPQIAEWLADNNLKDIKGTTEYYNRYIVNGYMKELTEEEMQTIVEWIKGE